MCSTSTFGPLMIKPQLLYQISNPPTFLYCTTLPQTITVNVDNEGGMEITVDLTVSATNATISDNSTGPSGLSATIHHVLVLPRQSFSVSFYVTPFNNASSFKIFISRVKLDYGSDPTSNLIYFVFQQSILIAANKQSILYTNGRNPLH